MKRCEDINLSKTIASKRVNCKNLFSINLYEDSIPWHPKFVDEWARIIPYGSAPKRNWTSVGTESNVLPYKIGIVSDVHQNTVMFKSVLEKFREEHVSAIFCLGDYSYTEKPDDSGKRAKQVDMFMSLLVDWLNENTEREAVVLLGNHEIESHYYASDAELTKVKKIISKWSNCKRMYLTSDPFSSYEVDNCFDVTAYFGNNRRTFRLSHAISKEFVIASYMGLDSHDIDTARDRIVSYLGQSWLHYQSLQASIIRKQWNQFLKAPLGSKERQELIDSISANIRDKMNTSRIIENLIECGGDIGSCAGEYQRLLDNVNEGKKYHTETFNAFWGPPLYIEAPGMSVNFALDLRRLYSSLGIGKMYSISGHFHADLGMFRASPEFGTYIIGVGGFQPRKLIASAFSAYILACGSREDILYRLSFPDDLSIDESEWDLSSC